MISGADHFERLHGDRVTLRTKSPDDASKDYDWATDPELMRLDAGRPCEFDFSLYLLVYPDGLADPEKVQFAIETTEGTHIGNCTCYNINRVQKEAEMGIIIGDRKYWGKGYGSDAAITLMKYIFADLEMQRIVLHTLEWNIRARECFKRCGFVECGRITKHSYAFIKMKATPF